MQWQENKFNFIIKDCFNKSDLETASEEDTDLLESMLDK